MAYYFFMTNHRTINGIDVDAKLIQNTFLPGHDYHVFSLLDLYIFLRCGLVKRVDVPYRDLIMLYEVEPELRRMFSPRFINGIDVGLPFIEGTFKNCGDTTITLTELYLLQQEGMARREDLSKHLAVLLDAVKPELDKTFSKIFDAV